jgi:hypothetical protein
MVWLAVWKDNRALCAHPLGTFYINITPVEEHYVLDYGKAEAGTAKLF